MMQTAPILQWPPENLPITESVVVHDCTFEQARAMGESFWPNAKVRVERMCGIQYHPDIASWTVTREP